jgi:quercetin dioxygenase-like cupin family protein
MTKAIRIYANGDPDVMRWEDIELPPPGPREVRIRHTRVHASSVVLYQNRGKPMSASPHKVVHPEIKPENTPELASHYVDVPRMPWEETKFAGIKIKVLYSDDRGITTALFKFDPGAVVPLHEHTALEQTFVIEGTIEDHEGVCGPGQFVWRPAGNRHEAVAPKGAIILGFFLKPNRFANGEMFFTEEGPVE